jgi:CheY-like chemotaxis protein
MDELKGASVLLLEDEFLIAMDAEEILKELGAAKVETAATLAEAERLAAGDGFDVAMLDVNINGEMSLPLARALRQRGVPVVLATGYEMRDEGLADCVAWLRKPYSREGLQRALVTALKERSADA